MINTADDAHNFPEEYMQLRTVLDCLEMNALRYVLKDGDESGRIKKAAEVKAMIMPIAEKLQSTDYTVQAGDQFLMADGGNKCEEGFFYCNGCCIPYPCPN